jgi:hypothetical protein
LKNKNKNKNKNKKKLREEKRPLRKRYFLTHSKERETDRRNH